jgi:glycosyltransferase involved in cell wall biosynthesis
MIRVLLVHAGTIPHYRIPIYGFLSDYLRASDFDLSVVSDGIQPESPHAVRFPYKKMPLSVRSIARLVRTERMDVIIDYMELKHRYLFPTYLVVKGLMGRKMVYWGQGGDLLDPQNPFKKTAYTLEQSLCEALVLYAEHLTKFVPRRFHKKTFVANNTLFLSYPGLPAGTTRESVLTSYGIKTRKNIICVGRMQKRKRIDHLAAALSHMNRPDIGLILVGPDQEGVLDGIQGNHIHKLGPLYEKAKFDLLSSADVFCLPGAVGLSIVDAFHCGLPFVTEEGDESAEIMYLKNGVNGFVVPNGDVLEMSRKLQLLLDDEGLRGSFSEAARREIRENGSMDKFCSGFRDALTFATRGMSIKRARPDRTGSI